jgi:hypothetical protein
MCAPPKAAAELLPAIGAKSLPDAVVFRPRARYLGYEADVAAWPGSTRPTALKCGFAFAQRIQVRCSDANERVLDIPSCRGHRWSTGAHWGSWP